MLGLRLSCHLRAYRQNLVRVTELWPNRCANDVVEVYSQLREIQKNDRDGGGVTKLQHLLIFSDVMNDWGKVSRILPAPPISLNTSISKYHIQ